MKFVFPFITAPDGDDQVVCFPDVPDTLESAKLALYSVMRKKSIRFARLNNRSAWHG